MDVAANFLREHLNLANRLHYVILEGGEAPNVVPDKASVWYYVRNTDEGLEDMYQRVVNCAKAGALASGTELASVRVLTAIHQRHANKAAAELFQKNIELVGMPAWSDEEQAFAKALQKELGAKEEGTAGQGEPDRAAADRRFRRRRVVGRRRRDPDRADGDHPFPGLVPGSIGHHWSTVAAGNTARPRGKGLNAGAKAIAASAIDLLTKPEELQAQDEFEDYSKHPYKPFLPADAPAE